jgi:hypothetical protein
MLLACSFLIAGCRPSEQIETYTVPVLRQPASKPAAVDAGEATDRMLAAILPNGDRAWFFKVVGPIAAVDPKAEAIQDFFATVGGSDDQAQVHWQTPDGWTEREGNGMRKATITIPTDGPPLELTVVGLPWSGGPSDVLSNVNRWRGQLQLPAIGPPGLAECTREISVEGGTATIVDLRGRMQETGMTAPFAGGRPAGATPSVASPPQADRPPPPAAAPGTPQFDVPAGWQTLPATPPRKAAFRVVDGQQEALVTVIDFPAAAGPMIADPLQNLNRWRREVGLPAIAAAELNEQVQEIDVDDRPASYFEVIPDAQEAAESKIDRATLAVMLPHGPQIWFFKMAGDRDLVAAERERFRSFVDSLQIPDDKGANDGN